MDDTMEGMRRLAILAGAHEAPLVPFLGNSNGGERFPPATTAVVPRRAPHFSTDAPSSSLGLPADPKRSFTASKSFSYIEGDSKLDSSWDAYEPVMKQQAADLEAALRAKSELEAKVRQLNSELQSLKNRSQQKDSELKQLEAQLRQKSSRLAALDAGGALVLDADSEVLDLRAERDALQDALRSAQQELVKEQASRTALEAKLNSAPSAAKVHTTDHTDEIKLLKEQLRAEQAEVASLQETLRRVESQWDASYQEAVSLKEAKARLESKIADSTADHEYLKERADHMQRLLESKDVTIKELTQKLERGFLESVQLDGSNKLSQDDMWKLGLTHDQMAAIDKIIDTWREGYNRKDQEVYEVREELDLYTADLSAANQQLGRLRAELEAAKADARDNEDAHIAERSELDRKLLNAQSLLNRTEQQLNQAIADSEAQHRAHSSEIASLKAKVKALSDEHEQSAALLEQRDEELSSLRRQAAQNNKIGAQLESQLKDVQSLFQSSELRLSTTCSELHARVQEVQKLSSAVEEEKATHSKLKQKLESSEAKLKAALSDRKDLEARLDACEEELSRKHTQMQECSRKESAMSADVSALRSELSAAQSEVHRLQQALKQSEASRRESENDLDSARQEADEAAKSSCELNRQLKSCRQELMDARQQLQEATSSGSELQLQLGEVRAKLREMTEQSALLSSDLEKRTSELGEAERELKVAASKLERADSELLASNAQIEQLSSSVASLMAGKGDLGAENARQAAKLEQCLADLSASKKDVDSLRAQLLEKQQALAAASRAREDVEKSLSQCQQSLKNQQSELAAVQASNQAVLQQHGISESALRQKLQALEHELTETQKQCTLSQEIEQKLLDAERRMASIATFEVRLAEASNYAAAAEEHNAELQRKLSAKESELLTCTEELNKHKEHNQQLMKESDSLQQQVSAAVKAKSEQISRITGIVKRAMDSILTSYQRSSRESSPTKDTSKDRELLDTEQFDNVEDMLGSLAQFAANKSHAVIRLEQEVSRKAEEIRNLEAELQDSWVAGQKDAEIESLNNDIADLKAECNELRVALSQKNEECASAHIELRVLNEEVQASRQYTIDLRREADELAEELAQVRREHHSSAMLDVARMREELEQAHSEVLPLKEQLNRRTREVRELNHMLKAWEAMRLGKDAQIASLMERCKRHEEEAAEKARSVDSLRRKLALAGRDSNLNSSGGSNRARHIHVHMHQQPPTDAGSEYDYGQLSSSLRNSQNY